MTERPTATGRSRRIVYAINSFEPGGAEHGLATLIENGFFRDHDLRIFVFAGGGGPVATRIEAGLGADRITAVSDRRRPGAWTYLAGAVALARLVVQTRPDAVVLSLKQTNLVGRLLLRAFPGVRCIAFEHITVYRARRGQALYGPLLRLLSGRVDEIWADTSETLDQVERYYRPNPGRRGLVVPLFCAAPGLPHKRAHATDGTLRIAAAGRLVSRKRFDLLVEAIGLLRTAGTPATLDLYGEGPEAETLAGQARAASLDGDVFRLHGYRADWTAAAAGADLFVNPSEMEGFCIVVAEAMAVGLPVIATDVGGVRDYGVDGRNMKKLPAAVTATMLADAIAALGEDEALRRALGTNARAEALARFSPAAIRDAGRRAFAATDDRPTGEGRPAAHVG